MTRCQAVEAARLAAATAPKLATAAAYVAAFGVGSAIVTGWRVGGWIGRHW